MLSKSLRACTFASLVLPNARGLLLRDVLVRGVLGEVVEPMRLAVAAAVVAEAVEEAAGVAEVEACCAEVATAGRTVEGVLVARAVEGVLVPVELAGEVTDALEVGGVAEEAAEGLAGATSCGLASTLNFWSTSFTISA